MLGIEGEQGILSISTDGGNSWPNTLKANLELDPNGLAVLGNNTYLAFDNNGCLWMTDDGGKTWSETSMTGGRVTSLSAAPKVYGLDKGAALAVNPACTDGLSTSRNGTTWTKIDQSQFGQYQVLSAAGTLNGMFFVGTAQGCVLASTDWCATWTPITSGIQGNILDIEAVAINGGDIVIAGTDNGLYWMEYQLPASDLQRRHRRLQRHNLQQPMTLDKGSGLFDVYEIDLPQMTCSNAHLFSKQWDKSGYVTVLTSLVAPSQTAHETNMSLRCTRDNVNSASRCQAVSGSISTVVPCQ